MKINLKLKAIIFFSLLVLSGCESVFHKKIPLENKISTFETEASLVTYLEKLKRFDDIETAHEKERKRKAIANGEYLNEEIIVTGTRASIQSAVNQSQLSGEIVDGLSVSQYDDISAEGIAEALETIEGASESITNNQEANVDQGDIIKQVGDNLVILRKGVLYSVSINGASNLELVSTVNLQGDVRTHEGWYDELLVSNNLLIVTGYNYEDNASELVFLTIDEFGKIEFDQRYFIGSSDYYDPENSATRIVGNELIMVLPNYRDVDALLEENESRGLSPLLAVRYSRSYQEPEKINIATTRKWVGSGVNIRDSYGSTDVLRCPLNQIRGGSLACNVTSLLGLTGEFYVHKNSVYIWSDESLGIDYDNITERAYGILLRRDAFGNVFDDRKRVIYKIGLRDDDVRGVIVKGYPFNKFSFQESNGVFSGISVQRKKLKKGWKKPVYGISFDLDQFSTELSDIPNSKYHSLLNNSTYGVQNRFLNEYAFVSNSSYVYPDSYDSLEKTTEVVIWNRQTNTIDRFTAGYDITAFHPQGKNVLAMGKGGSEGHLVLESWAVTPEPKRLFSSEFNKYRQAESRSVGFNSKKDNSGYIFGIPIYEVDQDGELKTYTNGEDDEQDVINISYFRNPEDGKFTEIDQLKASVEYVEEKCIVSCDEWYGVARPFFIGDYIYALIDNEIVKGKLLSGRVKTLNRVNLINGQVSFE